MSDEPKTEVEPKLEKETVDRLIYDYWMSAFKRAWKKMPVKEWETAEKRYAAVTGDDETKRPVVNDLRNHVEISSAFLDQREPSFKITVSESYAGVEAAQMAADCERKYLEYVWGEQDCQIVESQKLGSALIRNVGFSMPIFDMKKWMPDLRYLPPRDVRIDPDCGGILARATWMAYKEDISLEELVADVRDLTKDEIETIKKRNPSVLTDDEQEAVEDKEPFIAATRWHVFARNAAAVRDFAKMEKDDETDPPSLVDELKLKTERRYLQFVEGIHRPLKDKKQWPFDLDHKEFPITQFMLNQVPEDLYGFTDYQQMERMDTMSDAMMQFIEENGFKNARTKYLAGKSSGDMSAESINNFLNEQETSVLMDMLGEDDKPLLKEVTVAKANEALVSYYNLFHEESIKASADSELAIETVADYKEVTAVGVRADLERRQQRNNHRLAGPRSYEKTIQEDAVKMLEIAHQFVPRLSVISFGREEDADENLQALPWAEAQEALLDGGHLLKLGIDAIVGPELAKFWMTPDEIPMVAIRLSTKTQITPGSTRNLTQEQQAATLIEFYQNVLFPTIYEPMQRYDLASKYLEYTATFMQGLERMEEFLPTKEAIEQFQQQAQEAAQAEQQAAQEQAELETAQGQQKLETEGQSAQIKVGTAAAQAQIAIGSAEKKAELDERKAKMQLKAKPKAGAK